MALNPAAQKLANERAREYVLRDARDPARLDNKTAGNVDVRKLSRSVC